MKLEIIQSPVYRLENGIPAYKSGEWEGIKPNHFGRTRLLLKQIRNNDNPKKLIHKKIIQKSSSEFTFKPSKKQVNSYFENIQRKNNIKYGRKYIEPNNLRNIIKINRCSSINSIRPKDNYTINSIILPKISIKNDEKPINYRNISFSSSSELNIENLMNKKKRIYSLEQQRNYYRECNPGDKNFRYAECSPDFFKEGGLIVGSTNRIRITDNFNKLRNNIYQTMDLNKKTLDINKLWKSKILKEREKSEADYVFNLEQWEKQYIQEEENKNSNEKGKSKGKNGNNINKSNEKAKKKVKIK